MMKKLITVSAAILLLSSFAKSQGCIAVRNLSGLGQYNLTSNSFSTSEWELNINNRYFSTYKDYKGTTDLKTPPPNQNIIKSFTTDFALTRLLKKGWSLEFSLPLAANSHTGDLEHGGANTTRYTTSAAGIGDISFTGYKWLLAPSPTQKGNIQLGLGIKLPTGAYNARDNFHRSDGSVVSATVLPSVQLGDSGTGIITELNTFYMFNKTFNLYGNFYYLINPKGQSNVAATFGGRVPSDTVIRAGGAFVTVADVYSMRAGATFNLTKWAFSMGLRDEGTPVNDLIGSSLGVRRAGYTVSVEPGVIYKLKNAAIYAYVPYIVAHSITQNNVDKNISKITGAYTVSPGGSGDYQVFLGIQFMF
jgi:hypothetical protein